MDKPNLFSADFAGSFSGCFSGIVAQPNVAPTLMEWCLELANQYGLTFIDTPSQDSLFLSLTNKGIGLCDTHFLKQKPVVAEFTSTEMDYRLKASTVKSELIMRAIGNKQAPWNVIDATPGLGRDAMVMAHFGCNVTMLERSPAVAMLLSDGLRLLSTTNIDLHSRLQLYLGDSIHALNTEHLADKHIPQPDVVYLDPMFPHKKKSALVKKEMQLFQRLLGNDPDADSLFLSALKVAKKRVVVKRPNYAEPLNHQEPNLTITSKKHRFDVYLTHSMGDK